MTSGCASSGSYEWQQLMAATHSPVFIILCLQEVLSSASCWWQLLMRSYKRLKLPKPPSKKTLTSIQDSFLVNASE